MQNCTTHERCVSTALQKAQLLCEDKKLRFTDIRRKVLELVWKRHVPAKAYDILEALKDGDYSAKPPTVYRALDFLLQNRLIHKLYHQNAYIGCTHPREQHLCQLLVCTECGVVEESCDSKAANALWAVADKNAFHLRTPSIELQGLCCQCH